MARYKYIWPKITTKTRAAVNAQLDKGEISIYDRSGIFAKFEDEFAAYHRRKHALLFSSGTAALHAAMVGCELSFGDQVICPSYTFFASVSPLFQTGAIPVLCESRKDGNIDPMAIEKLISMRTKAVIVTHMWGQPCDMDPIVNLCKKYKLKLIEDCSHAHGAKYKGKLVGTFGDVAAYSLQGPKVVSGGEGGVLITDDRNIYERALLLGHYNKRCRQEIKPDSPYYEYAVTGFGLKLRAHPFAIAMTMEQFTHLNNWHKRMNDNAKFFYNELKGIPHISLPKLDKAIEPSWYAFVLQLDLKMINVSAKQICQELNDAGIKEADYPSSTSPLNQLKLFQDPSLLYPHYQGEVNYKKGDFPIAEEFYTSAIKFPIDILTSKLYRNHLKKTAKLLKTIIYKHSKVYDEQTRRLFGGSVKAR